MIIYPEKQIIDRYGKPRQGYYMDKTLVANLDFLKRMVANKWDGVSIVCGQVGCLFEDTKIKTNNGDIALREINSDSILVKAIDFKKQETTTTMAYVVSTGKKAVYKLKLQDGRYVTASEEHIFFVKRNDKLMEIKLKDIEKTDEILCK